MRLASRVIRQGGGAAGNLDLRADARRRAGVATGDFGADLLLFGGDDGTDAQHVFLVAAIAVDEQRQPPVAGMHVDNAEFLLALAGDDQATRRVTDEGQAGVFHFQLRRNRRAHALRIEHTAIAQLRATIGRHLEAALRIEAVATIRGIAHGAQEDIVAGQLGHVGGGIATAADVGIHAAQLHRTCQQARARIDGNAEIRCRVSGEMAGGGRGKRTAAVAQAELRRQDTDGIGLLCAVERDAPGVADIGGHVIHRLVRIGASDHGQAGLCRDRLRGDHHAVGGDDRRRHHDGRRDRCFRRAAIAAATACGKGRT